MARMRKRTREFLGRKGPDQVEIDNARKLAGAPAQVQGRHNVRRKRRRGEGMERGATAKEMAALKNLKGRRTLRAGGQGLGGKDDG